MDLIIKELIKFNKRLRPFSKKNPSQVWHKVGKVKALFVYPLAKGVAENVTSCCIYRNYILGYKDKVPMQNHMFVVYDESTNVIYTRNEIPKFTMFRISVESENVIALKGYVSSVNLILKDIVADGNVRTCMTSFSNKFLVNVEVLDCGDIVANWLKNQIKNDRLRLGYISLDAELQNTKLQEITLQYEKWNSNNESYKDFMIPFECVPPLTLLSCDTFDQVISKCTYDQLQQLHPNIVISPTSGEPFDEMKWQQIRIGDHVVVNNINNVNWKNRPMSKINLKNTPIDMKWETMPLHCEVLYSGVVERDDEVFALYSEETSEDD